MFEDGKLRGKIEAIVKRHAELSQMLGDPNVIAKRNEFRKLAQEHADVDALVATWKQYTGVLGELEETRALLEDPEMGDLASEELPGLESRKTELEKAIQILLLPKDPNDGKNILLEIRAGTGGDEAALFAGDLLRMYTRFAERRRWKVETLSASEGSSGGYKEAILLIEGKEVYSVLKYESGVHRVQRVPATESQGRVHTSAATIVVLPEAEEIDLKIDDKELRIDVMRAGGPGGQSVNTTDSAVRITHIPTGIIVIQQDEKSQHKNKAKAMRVLRSRLLDHEQAKQDAEERDKRRALVKSGDRSEKVRTYNFPQDRMTDHRIGLTKHNLPNILDGDLDDTIAAIRAHFQAEALKEVE